MLDVAPRLFPGDFPDIDRRGLQTLQVNLGYLCNQTCQHCHVNAGPNRTELMDKTNIDHILAVLDTGNIATLDLTGGAPELNPYFRYLVEGAHELGVHVLDRCNLTILEEPGQHDLAEFLANNQVEVIASLPCYLEENVNDQRGKGVFKKSIDGLRRLNTLGYGQVDDGLQLQLVYNPIEPALPPEQQQLEADYKRELKLRYGVSFNKLFVLTNLPIQRFGSMLLSRGQFEDYMSLLKAAYQPCNLDAVMCRDLLSVNWQGYVYDCDFNQMLDLPLTDNNQRKLHISELDLDKLPGQEIRTADHCYGCTAGQGSSCGGALA